MNQNMPLIICTIILNEIIWSEIDLLDRECLNKYPRLANAKYSEYVLAPGEMIFIPRWHWHFIVAIDTATAYSFRKTSGLSWKRCIILLQTLVFIHLNIFTSDDGLLENSIRESLYSFSVNFWWGRRILKEVWRVNLLTPRIKHVSTSDTEA